MKLAAVRECAASHGPIRPDACNRRGGQADGRRAVHVCAAALAVVAAAMLSAAPLRAQQTIVIGDDKPSADAAAAPQAGTSGVVVNDDVLDSLGGPGAFVPPLPPTSPYAEPAAAGQQPLAARGAPGTAYRLPETGQLVISRPSTLLFPPQTFPSSRLTVPPPPGNAARAAAPSESGKAQSRLMVPKPAQPTAPQIAQPSAPATATPTAPAVPREPVTQAPPASAPTAELPPAAEAAPASEPAPMAAPAAVEEPAPPPITPSAEPVAPAAAPSVAAVPPEPAPVAEPPAPPPLAKDLLSQPPPAAAGPAPGEMPAGELAPATPPLGAPAAESMPAPTQPSQSAALPPTGTAIAEMRVLFEDGSAELSPTATSQLDGVAQELVSNAEARVQLLAFAKASDDGTSRARRLSLSRALAVRAYLIEKGVRSTRMDVRALGSGFESGPPDRVDILPIESTQ